MAAHHGLKRWQAYILYLNHALTTWNARTYGFAAVIFTASAYPDGLRAASLIGISTSLATILFASSIGRWIDHGTSRLKTLLATISINRLSAISAYLLWFFIVDDHEQNTKEGAQPWWNTLKTTLFSTLLVLGIVESLSRKANVISIERDWVPVLAKATSATGYSLTHVNAMISRIDIMCKLLAPIAMSGFLSIVSIRVGVLAVLVTNVLSFIVEVWSARLLWEQCPELAKRNEPECDTMHSYSSRPKFNVRSWSLYSFTLGYFEAFSRYFDSDIWLASFAMCVTHASILSATGVTIVFFLDAGYSLQLVTAVEALSAFFELISTLLYPFAVKKLARSSSPISSITTVTANAEDLEDDLQLVKTSSHAEELETELVDSAISRMGLSGIMSMVTLLLPSVPVLLYLTHMIPFPVARNGDSPTLRIHPLSSLILFFCLASSRLGHGIFSLSTQQLAQSRLPPDQRSSFAGTETAFVSTFGLAHSLGTAIWSDPKGFGWLALASWMMIASSAALYAWWWLRERRIFTKIRSFGLGRYTSIQSNE